MNNIIKTIRDLSFCQFLSALVIALSVSSCTNCATRQNEENDNAAATDSVATATIDSSAYTPFVIYGVDMDCDAIKNGDFIWMGDLPTTDRPESSFDGFTLPLTKAVITGHKDVVGKLAPDVTAYIIDGKSATKDDFNTLDVEKIQRINIDGQKLVIETRFSTDEPNPDVKIAVDEEGRLYRRSAQQ
ncbi:MAG: hypothetical protein Q4C34_08935 [Bacteroidales bacterium]|nr:hypothetical protein [Bacteroidales bacterium]